MGQQRRRVESTPTQLTKRQAHWAMHLRACAASGLTSKAYAEKHQLSIHGLYQARKELRRREVLASPAKSPSVTFAKVRAEPRVARGGVWRVRFSNGAVLELEAPREREDEVWLLKTVAGLS